MTLPSPPGIRAGAPKAFFFAPFTGTQCDPPTAPPGPRHIYYPDIRSSGRPHVGSKYDVRAAYFQTHPLYKPLSKSASQATASEPSINDYFAKAQISDDDAFLKPLWQKETIQRGGWEAAPGLEAESSSGTSQEVQSDTPSPSFSYTFLFANALLHVFLFALTSFFELSSVSLGGVWSYFLLCAAYTLFPLTLWVRDGVLQVSLRAGRYKRSKTFWVCLVVGVVVANWWLDRYGAGEAGVVLRRNATAGVGRGRVSITIS